MVGRPACSLPLVLVASLTSPVAAAFARSRYDGRREGAILTPLSRFSIELPVDSTQRQYRQNRAIRLYAANEKDDENIVDVAKKGVGWFFSSPLWTATLFLSPFLCNPSLRSKLGPFISPPAIVALVSIVTSGYYLQNRLSDIVQANDKRRDTLKVLRDSKRKQLSQSGTVTTEDISLAASAYEEALRNELSLRQILPGVPRITAYLDPKDQAEDLAATRQFLGLEINENGDLVPES